MKREGSRNSKVDTIAVSFSTDIPFIFNVRFNIKLGSKQTQKLLSESKMINYLTQNSNIDQVRFDILN